MLLGLAAVFAVVNGANDGGAMLAATLKLRGLRPVLLLALLAAALAVVPLVLGTGVADTLTSGLVKAGADARPRLIAVGAVAAIVVVGGFSRAGLPTSLTLGTVGGIVGAGLGRGMPVVAGGLGKVILIGLAAPVAGALMAQALTKVSAATVAGDGERGIARLHRVAAPILALAYAANDGQKMVAVLAVTAVGVTAPALIGIALLFAVGTAIGLSAAARTLGVQILRAVPREEVTAELGASAAVLVSAALGVPVSMTQAISGGLIGTGLMRGRRQVRWRVAGQLALAWVLTLPTALLIGAALGWTFGRLT